MKHLVQTGLAVVTLGVFAYALSVANYHALQALMRFNDYVAETAVVMCDGVFTKIQQEEQQQENES